MRTAKQLRCLFTLMLGLFLYISQAAADSGACYVPPSATGKTEDSLNKSNDAIAKTKNDMIIMWNYDTDQQKFKFLNMHLFRSGKNEPDYKLGETASVKATGNKYTITWVNGAGMSSTLLVVNDNAFERSFARIVMPDGTSYHNIATCVFSSPFETIDKLLPKLQKKLNELTEGPSLIPVKKDTPTPQIPSKL